MEGIGHYIIKKVIILRSFFWKKGSTKYHKVFTKYHKVVVGFRLYIICALRVFLNKGGIREYKQYVTHNEVTIGNKANILLLYISG
jgi:hypothetical protein